MANIDPNRTKEVLDRVERERGMARGWTRILAEWDPDLLEHLWRDNLSEKMRQSG
jgi:hypothetical protein